jgi:DNA segregation ATPase FtsK/SpoIIIE, S-DNA-T family
VARRKASQTGWAQLVGISLIALGLLIGASLLPSQGASAPTLLAKRLGETLGQGAVALPGVCLFFGLLLFVRETLRLGSRMSGILLGYVTSLALLQLQFPAGSEFVAASSRKGGGYLGAVVTVGLRRAVGDSGLWIVVLGGMVGSILLLSGLSLADLLHGALTASQRLGSLLERAGRRVGSWGVAGTLAGGRVGGLAALALRTAVGVLHALVVQPVRATAQHVQEEWARRRIPRVSRTSVSPSYRAFPQDSQGNDAFSPPRPSEGEALRIPVPAGLSRLRSDDITESSRRSVATVPTGGRHSATGGRQSERGGHTTPVVVQGGLDYALPPLSLLDPLSAKAKSGKVDPEEVARNLERTLESFGVEARVIRWEIGPVVTRYELQPAPGVKVQKITSLQNDIALALAASSVRLEAPIPGKSAIGVELPNERPGLVHLREILTSEEFQTSSSPLTVAIGKAIAGQPVVADLVAMPHVLIAGATGAGKSVAINSMIASILFRATPAQVRFLMIDPKRVELTNYNGIPHLLSPVVTVPREAAAKLRWAIQEMESRYEMFAAEGVRNIQAFNAQFPDRPLASILIIIDELADLMMVAPADFEEIICRLAQMTRAVGIHLLVATQRPSVDVITGLIKANIPSRMAFAVTSQVDSRTILDHPGAEKLLGKGDMLFSPIGATRPTRVQGSFISDAETERLVEFWRVQAQPEYLEELVHAGEDDSGVEEGPGSDALLADAARLIVRAGYASVSLLQRKMRIGYVRAARLVDQLEEKGIVGPAQGSNPREILATLGDLDRILRQKPARPQRTGTSSVEEEA